MPDENTNPWDSDLAERFDDEATRAAVSEFLGEKVQPYVTQLEEKSKPNRDAAELWDNFNSEPVATTYQVLKELYGEDKADQFAAILQGEEAETPEEGDVTKETPTETAETPQGVEFDQLPPEVQKIVQDARLEENRRSYYNEIERITQEKADALPKDAEGKPELDTEMFHPFVVASEGDFDKAFEGYQKWYSKFNPTTETTEDGSPPPILNSSTRDSAAAPPVVKKNQTIDDALDDMFSDMNAPPPTVGAV